MCLAFVDYKLGVTDYNTHKCKCAIMYKKLLLMLTVASWLLTKVDYLQQRG